MKSISPRDFLIVFTLFHYWWRALSMQRAVDLSTGMKHSLNRGGGGWGYKFDGSIVVCSRISFLMTMLFARDFMESKFHF